MRTRRGKRLQSKTLIWCSKSNMQDHWFGSQVGPQVIQDEEIKIHSVSHGEKVNIWYLWYFNGMKTLVEFCHKLELQVSSPYSIDVADHTRFEICLYRV